jgi:site-specific recombinase XerD
MEVVYFFCESSRQGENTIRIPFFGYDKRLFRLFAAQGGGVWNNGRQEFIFRQDTNINRFEQVFATVPCVVVENNSSEQPRIFGFFERLWEQSPVTRPAQQAKQSGAHPVIPAVTMLGPLPLPEKFSEQWRLRLEAALRSRKYSSRTQSLYIYFNRLLCRTLQKTPEEIDGDDIIDFLAIMEKDKDYSASSLNLAISAIKFFFRNVLKNNLINEQHRPRHDKNLPMILSREETKRVFSMEKNPKHRLLLMMVYSSGLRVSEVVALKKDHIDLSRKVIYIRLGKGRKDRYTLLSEKAASFLEEYYAYFGIQTWLFPGQPSSRHLTIRSAQRIFDKAVTRAGIPKKLSIHSLRHTFATHLLEDGTDIRYIQTLLGHASLRTTERYTHVAKRSVLKIKSPLDSIL